MKKKSFMAPKRMSGRPSRSRLDAQIDARSFLLRDGVRFRTVPCARSGDIPQYRLQLESDNDNIVGLGAIAQVTSAKNIDFISIRTYSDFADDNAPDMIFQDRPKEGQERKVTIEHSPVIIAIRTLENR